MRGRFGDYTWRRLWVQVKQAGRASTQACHSHVSGCSCIGRDGLTACRSVVPVNVSPAWRGRHPTWGHRAGDPPSPQRLAAGCWLRPWTTTGGPPTPSHIADHAPGLAPRNTTFHMPTRAGERCVPARRLFGGGGPKPSPRTRPTHLGVRTVSAQHARRPAPPAPLLGPPAP